MTPIEKLRRIADMTALEGVADAIREVADEMERGVMADHRRLQFLEDETMRGNAPNLVFDDDGNWAVSYAGFQPCPEGGGKGFHETVGITCVVGPEEWRPSIRHAIDDAMRAAEEGAE